MDSDGLLQRLEPAIDDITRAVREIPGYGFVRRSWDLTVHPSDQDPSAELVVRFTRGDPDG